MFLIDPVTAFISFDGEEEEEKEEEEEEEEGERTIAHWKLSITVTECCGGRMSLLALPLTAFSQINLSNN